MQAFKKIALTVFLSIALPTLADQQFINVDGNSPYYDNVKELFEEVIAPIYGNQDTALQKIASAQDRTCVLLIDDSEDVKQILGVLVYKTFPVQEFSSNGIPSALEIKTLFVVNAEKNSGRGIGTQLINKVFSHAQSNEQFQNIVVTVSEKKTDALRFFKYKGFEIIDSWTDAYQKGTTEHLLSKKAR